MQIIQCQDIVTCHKKRDNDPVSHTPTDMDNAMLIYFYCVYIKVGHLAIASFQNINLIIIIKREIIPLAGLSQEIFLQ